MSSARGTHIFPTPNENDARAALGDHVAEKAAAARLRYGPRIDADAIVRMLADRSIVRYPTELSFDGGALEVGEFAYALALGESPDCGFRMVLHPCFESRREVWPLLIAYHLPTINYGDIVSADECERFGAALLGVEPEAYYQTLCELADSIPAPAEEPNP